MKWYFEQGCKYLKTADGENRWSDNIEESREVWERKKNIRKLENIIENLQKSKIV